MVENTQRKIAYVKIHDERKQILYKNIMFTKRKINFVR
jgi:hypothetical protein